MSKKLRLSETDNKKLIHIRLQRGIFLKEVIILTEKCRKDQKGYLAYSMVLSESEDSVCILCFYRNTCEKEHVGLIDIKRKQQGMRT